MLKLGEFGVLSRWADTFCNSHYLLLGKILILQVKNEYYHRMKWTTTTTTTTTIPKGILSNPLKIILLSPVTVKPDYHWLKNSLSHQQNVWNAGKQNEEIGRYLTTKRAEHEFTKKRVKHYFTAWLQQYSCCINWWNICGFSEWYVLHKNMANSFFFFFSNWSHSCI